MIRAHYSMQVINKIFILEITVYFIWGYFHFHDKISMMMYSFDTYIVCEYDLFLPVNRQYGPWQDWGACSTSCGNGMQMRKRYCPLVMGCMGNATESRKCENVKCHMPTCPSKLVIYSSLVYMMISFRVELSRGKEICLK